MRQMGGEREVWELVALLAEEYRRRQFRVLVGRGTDPFGRHELGILFSWDDIAREKSFFERLAEAEDILYSGWDVPWARDF